MNQEVSKRILASRIKVNRTDQICAWGIDEEGRALCNILGYCLLSQDFLNAALAGGQAYPAVNYFINDNTGPYWPVRTWREFRRNLNDQLYTCLKSSELKDQIQALTEEKITRKEIF